MEERINAGQRGSAGKPSKTPPALPSRMVDLWPVAIAGTVAWLLAFVVLLFVGHTGVWLYTALSGFALGFVGMLLMFWQRAASRRGTRGAQRNL